MRLIWLCFFIFLISAPSLLAQHTISFYVSPRGTTARYQLELEKGSQVSLPLQRGGENIEVYADGKSLEFGLEEESGYVTLNFLAPQEKVTVEFFSSAMLKGDSFLAQVPALKGKITLEARLYNLKLATPLGSSSPSAFPSPKSVSSDGQGIILNWEFENLTETEVVLLLLKPEKNPAEFWVIGLIVFGLGILGIVIWRRAKRKFPHDSDYLLDTEKRVLEIITKHNPIWQGQLQRESGLTKSRLSRLLRNLEERGLIEKIPLGNANKIKLK